MPSSYEPLNAPLRKEKKSAVPLLLTLIVLLLIGVGILLRVNWKQRQTARYIQAELSTERDSLAVNLRHVLVEYDQLETENVQMQQKLDEEKARVQELIDEVNAVQQLSLSKIREYQRELGTLRAIMRDMVIELDSINTINRTLSEENIRIRDQYSVSQRNVAQLTQEKEQMSETISTGSTIRVRNIILTGLNRRDKDTQRARNTTKLRSCFTLMENAIAQNGETVVYLRIIDPNGDVLPSEGQEAITQENGETVLISAKRVIDYQRQDIDVCIYYGLRENYSEGAYTIEVYINGKLAGKDQGYLK